VVYSSFHVEVKLEVHHQRYIIPTAALGDDEL